MNENVDPAVMREVRPTRYPAPPVTSPPRKRRTGLRLGVALLLAVAAIFVWERWEQLAPGTVDDKKPAEKSAPPPQTIRAATANYGDMPITIDALGTVTPLATVTVHTQIAGRLMSVGFTEGQLVKTGDFLDQIDPRPYEAALALAQGQLAKDTALLQQAQADLARYVTLTKQDSIARQQVEDQQFLVAQDKAAIQSDQAQIDTAKLNIGYTHIVSPINGRVGLRLIDAGNYVQPTDATGLVVITELDPISVVFTTPEDNLPRITRAAERGRETAGDRARPRQRQTARGRRTDDLRQRDRHHDRHVQAAGDLRQSRQHSVPEPVRQRAAAGRHAEPRRAGSQRRGATRAERAVCLRRQRRKVGRGPQSEERPCGRRPHRDRERPRRRRERGDRRRRPAARRGGGAARQRERQGGRRRRADGGGRDASGQHRHQGKRKAGDGAGAPSGAP